MTAESVIADGVAEMHAALAKEPPSEAMRAFSREQAALAATGVPARRLPTDRCPSRKSTTWPSPC